MLSAETFRMLLKKWDFPFTEEERKAQECEWIHSGHKASLAEWGAGCGLLTLTDLCPGSLWLHFVPWCSAWEEQQERSRPGKVTKPLLNLPTSLWRNSFLTISLLELSVEWASRQHSTQRVEGCQNRGYYCAVDKFQG